MVVLTGSGHLELDDPDIVVTDRVFDVTKLFLDQLLVAKYVIQFGWDGVAEVENTSASTANSQNYDASQSFLTDAAPKPWLYFRG